MVLCWYYQLGSAQELRLKVFVSFLIALIGVDRCCKQVRISCDEQCSFNINYERYTVCQRSSGWSQMIKPVCRLATCVILFAGLKVRRQKAGEVGCSWSAKQADKLPDDKTRISRDSSHLAGEERAKRKKGITSALFTEDVRQKCLATCLISRLLQNVCT